MSVSDKALENKKIDCHGSMDALIRDVRDMGLGSAVENDITKFYQHVIIHMRTLDELRIYGSYSKEITNRETNDHYNELNDIINIGRSFLKNIKYAGEPSKIPQTETVSRILGDVTNQMDESLKFAIFTDELRRENLRKLQNGKLPANSNSLKKECEQVLKAFADTLHESKLVESKVIDEFVASAGNCLSDVSNAKEWSRKVSGGGSREKFFEEFKECFVNARGSFKQGSIPVVREEVVDGVILPMSKEEKPSKENIQRFLDMLAYHTQIIKHKAFCGSGDKDTAYVKLTSGGHCR